MLAFTVLADPKRVWGVDLLPPDPTDARPLKLAALERAGRFELLIVGDSRGQRLEPEHVRRRTGLTAFNGSVTAGRIDAVEYVVDRGLRPRHGRVRAALILSGPEVLNQDHGLFPSMPDRLRASLTSETLKLSVDGLLEELSLLKRPEVWRYAADGRETFTTAWDFAEVARAGGPTRRALDYSIKVFDPAWRLAAKAEGDRLDRVLGRLNAHGVEPVIVLMPYHPYLLRHRRPQIERARRHFLGLLEGMRPRRDFHVVDTTYPSVFGARMDGFADGLHMDERNMRALFDHVLREAPGAF